MPLVPDFEKVLLRKARQDVRAAAVLAGDAGCDDELIGFHCQQAVEKSIKAVLETFRVEYPLTHDLLRLLALLGVRGPDSLPECPAGTEDAMQLNPFAIRFRYENDLTEPDPTFDRVQAINAATATVEWAAGIVEKR